MKVILMPYRVFRIFVLGASLLVGNIVHSKTMPVAGIPNHYSKLVFPEFKYVPPHPKDYRVVLDKGVPAYLVPDTGLGLVEVSLLFRNANLAEKPSQTAPLSMYSSMLKAGGTIRFTPEQLDDSLEYIAAAVSAHLNNYQSEVAMNVMEKDAYPLLDLLPEIALQPRLDAAVFRLNQKKMIERIAHRYDTPRAVLSAAFEHVLFGSHPVNWVSTEKEAAALKPADLKPWMGKGFDVQNLVIAVSGRYDQKRMIKQLNHLIGRFAGASKPITDSIRPFKGQKEPGVYLVDKLVTQANIQMGAPGVKRPHPDYYPLTLASYALGAGGFSSRLVSRVRTDEGLAYSVNSYVGSDYERTSTVGVSLQTKVETAAFAVRICLEEMEKMAKGGITEKELQNAKDGLIKSLPSMFDTPASTANIFAQNEIWKRDLNHFEDYVKSINSLTQKKVNETYKRYFQKDSMRIVVVGPKDKLLKKDAKHGMSLSDFGKVKMLTTAEIDKKE